MSQPTSPEVGDLNTPAGEAGPPPHPGTQVARPSAARFELERRREAASLALATASGFDIATISEEQFAGGLEKVRLRRERLQKLIETILVPDVHYDTRHFKSPHLTQPGADELRTFFHLHCKKIGSPDLIITPEIVVATVHVGIYDSAGNLLGERSASCSTMEKRFKARPKGRPQQAGPNGEPPPPDQEPEQVTAGPSVWTYQDPREEIHVCLAMAEKRAQKLLTAAVTGINAFFASKDAKAKMAQVAKPAAGTPAAEARAKEAPRGSARWTDAQRQETHALAHEAGILTQAQWDELLDEVLGRRDAIYTEDTALLQDALKKRKAAGQQPTTPTPTAPHNVKDGNEAYDAAAAAPRGEPAAQAAPPPHPVEKAADPSLLTAEERADFLNEVKDDFFSASQQESYENWLASTPPRAAVVDATVTIRGMKEKKRKEKGKKA